jgi:hypothetical protein
MNRRTTWRRPEPSYFGLLVGCLVFVILAFAGTAIYLTAQFS